jgi:RNA polymerase sigma-70 factor, ECF subfamily
MTESDAEAFCGRVLHRLVGSMALYVGDRGLAEEIAQEALARAWERWHRVSAMDSPEAWVFKTARNLARRQLTRRALERRAGTSWPEDRLDHDVASTVAVREAVAALPERQRTMR